MEINKKTPKLSTNNKKQANVETYKTEKYYELILLFYFLFLEVYPFFYKPPIKIKIEKNLLKCYYLKGKFATFQKPFPTLVLFLSFSSTLSALIIVSKEIKSSLVLDARIWVFVIYLILSSAAVILGYLWTWKYLKDAIDITNAAQEAGAELKKSIKKFKIPTNLFFLVIYYFSRSRNQNFIHFKRKNRDKIE